MKKKTKTKKDTKDVKKIVNTKIDVEQILLKQRELFMHDYVTNKSMLKLIKEIRALNAINNKPIYLWINSGGGVVSEGLALINVMKSVKSPIITIVNEEVCSMGSHIAIAGDQRLIYSNGVIMFHDMTSGIYESSLKIKDWAVFIERYYKLLEDNMRENTKLTNKELLKARTGHLWLFAEDCLDKGVVDRIIGVADEK